MTDKAAAAEGFSWIDIVRLGLVQTALGSVVVLTTSTLNRVMQVELGLLALVPAVFVGAHYLVQMSRPHWGHGADQGRARTAWIIGGMAVLALGGALAAAGVAWAAQARVPGLALTAVAFVLIGIGVGCAGTNLLALVASGTAPKRRPAAASVVWIMMIVGFPVTAVAAGAALEDFSYARLVLVSGTVSAIAMVLTLAGVLGVEARRGRALVHAAREPKDKRPFKEAVTQVWADGDARRFTLFVFVAMLAYNAQDIILEPFAGAVFGYDVGASTQLSGMHHGGVLLGLIALAALGRHLGSLRLWTVAGCAASGLAFVGLALGAGAPDVWPLQANVFILGFSNGAFAGAAVASMFALAGDDGGGSEGVRLGVWGAAQALGFGSAGLIGAGLKDGVFAATGSDAAAYGSVFALESALFVAAAFLAARIGGSTRAGLAKDAPIIGDFDAAEMAARG